MWCLIVWGVQTRDTYCHNRTWCKLWIFCLLEACLQVASTWCLQTSYKLKMLDAWPGFIIIKFLKRSLIVKFYCNNSSFQLPVCSLWQVKRCYCNNNRVIIIKFYDQGTFQKHYWLQAVETTCIKLVVLTISLHQACWQLAADLLSSSQQVM